jgi:hypothetical protein
MLCLLCSKLPDGLLQMVGQLELVEGGPRIISQILVPKFSMHEHCSAYPQDSLSNSSTTSTQKVLVGE